MPGRPPWPVIVALLVYAALIGAAGLASLPPDEHEALVLRTTIEMQARGDWVVPYFNDAPRLNKPPLSYWATALTAALAGTGDAIAPWHGRLPSLLAGLGMVGVLVVAGSRLYGTGAALVGGLLLAGSAGFYAYAHDARPDCLYAFWCSSGLALGALALCGATRRPRACLLAMWACYALATLGKGPHVPALLLIGTCVWLRLERRPLAALLPGPGLLLYCALALPWWLALWLALESGPVRVEGSQLAGRLLVPSFRHVLNGYYLYRPLQLVLPWLVLFAAGLWAAWVGRRDADSVTDRYFACAIVTVLAGLSLGSQQRYFYALPLLPALCLVVGQGAVRLLASPWPWRLQAALTATAFGWLAAMAHAGWPAGLVAAGAACVAAGPPLARRLAGGAGPGMVRMGGARAADACGLLLASAVLTAAALILPATRAQLWSEDRVATAALARVVANVVPAAAPVAAFELSPEVYVYIAARTIPRLAGITGVQAWLAATGGGQGYLLLELARMPELARHLTLVPVNLMPEGVDDRTGLYRVSVHRPAASTGGGAASDMM